MPALAGIIYPSSFNINKRIDNMLDSLQHRGKGTKEIFKHRNVVLGAHSDVKGYNKTRSVWLALDGTIFNQEEIIKDLEAENHSLNSHDLLPVLIKSYEVWGVDFVKKLNGPFLILLFDLSRQEVLLVRDRFGVKPLYWAHYNNHLIFASESKAILATGMVPRIPYKNAFASYLFFGFIPQDMTLIKEVNKLLPGHYLYSGLHQNLTIRSYWSFGEAAGTKIKTTEEEVASKLNDLLIQATKRRLVDEKEVGCFVLGGIGSAGICHYLNRLKGSDNTVMLTSSFENVNEEDLQASQEVANALKIRQENLVLKPQDLLENLIPIIWYLDEPIADPNIIATWNLVNKAKEIGVGSFSGMGSDELLAGNLRYVAHFYQESFPKEVSKFLRPSLKKVIVPILKIFNKKFALKILKNLFYDPGAMEYLKHNAIFDQKSISSISPNLAKTFFPETYLQNFYRYNLENKNPNSFLLLDAETMLTDRYLLQYERITGALGVNWKAPFLDKEVVDYLLTVPEELKIQNDNAALPLKKILQPIYPESYLSRSKKVRSNIFACYCQNAEFNEVFNLLSDGVLVESGLIDYNHLKKELLNSYLNPKRFQRLWAILILEIWFRLFFNRPIDKIPLDTSIKKFLSEQNNH